MAYSKLVKIKNFKIGSGTACTILTIKGKGNIKGKTARLSP